jgi:hypothetical protein
VAAAGAGVDRWLHCRGSRSRFRRDRFHRAHARPDPVPGSTDFLIGGIHADRADALRQRICLSARVLLSERIIVPGHISVGEGVCIPIGAFVQVAERIRIPQVVPVRLPDPDAYSFHILPDPVGLPDPHTDHIVPVPARFHVGERSFVRIDIGIGLAGADAWRRGSVLRIADGHRVGALIRCQGGTR